MNVKKTRVIIIKSVFQRSKGAVKSGPLSAGSGPFPKQASVVGAGCRQKEFRAEKKVQTKKDLGISPINAAGLPQDVTRRPRRGLLLAGRQRTYEAERREKKNRV